MTAIPTSTTPTPTPALPTRGREKERVSFRPGIVTAFRCVAIQTEIADRFRRSGRDDSGNVPRRIVASRDGGFPCRHCLRLAEPGETMLLGSYNPPRPRGIYWTPSPIFLHETACRRADSENEIAPIVRANPLVSVRAYDAADQCIYDLGHVCAGADVDGPLARALGDPRTAFVNIHTARPGCLLSMVERVSGGSGSTRSSNPLSMTTDAPIQTNLPGPNRRRRSTAAKGVRK